MRIRWVIAAAAAALFCATTATARAVAPADPEAALKELNQWYTDELQKARSANTQVDYRQLMTQRTEKAKAAVQDIDAAKVEPAKCMALAQLYQAAQMPAQEVDPLKRFLGTKPEASQQYQAQQLLLNAYMATDNAKPIPALIGEMKPANTMASLMLASMAASASELVGDKLGVKAALDMMDKAEQGVKYDQLQTDQEKRYGDSIKVRMVLSRAELLEKSGKKDAAIALLTKAKEGADPKSPVARQIASKLALMNIVGAPAPALKRERGYGDFPGLDKLAGKVVVLDFGAHW